MHLRLLLACSFLFTLGCSTAGNTILLGSGETYPVTQVETIQILDSPPTEPHTVFAVVEGIAATDDYFSRKKTHAAALNAMKQEAAQIGADAILYEGSHNQEYGGMWDKIQLKGKAIKYIAAP